jgi:hypothetical protein
LSVYSRLRTRYHLCSRSINSTWIFQAPTGAIAASEGTITDVTALEARVALLPDSLRAHGLPVPEALTIKRETLDGASTGMALDVPEDVPDGSDDDEDASAVLPSPSGANLMVFGAAGIQAAATKSRSGTSAPPAVCAAAANTTVSK